MSPPISLSLCASPVAALLAALLAALFAACAAAQPATPAPPPRASALDARAPVAPLAHRSALSAFRSASTPAVGWLEANQEVERIGGWRAYAREAHAQPAPTAAPPATAAPSPATAAPPANAASAPGRATRPAPPAMPHHRH